MTQRLTSALRTSRHLRSERVLCLPDGTPITLSTTQRDMHLSPAATEDAIRLLDGRLVDVTFTQNVEI